MSNLKKRLAEMNSNSKFLKKDDIIIHLDNTHRNEYFISRVLKDTEIDGIDKTLINLQSPQGFMTQLNLSPSMIKEVLPYVNDWYDVYEKKYK